MVRRLLTLRYLGYLVLAVLFAVACFYLGRWQWGRHEVKQARTDRVHAHYGAPVRPVDEVLSRRSLPLSQEWVHVTATGRYDERQIPVRNRPFEDALGYELLAPLRLRSGQTVVVDRGWVLADKDASTLPSLPPLPPGEVTVTGWVKPFEQHWDKGAPAGQVNSVARADVERITGGPVLGGYVVAGGERTADGEWTKRPERLGYPDTSLGPHQAYAYQWWAFMPFGLVGVLMAARREHLDELEAAGVETARQRKATRPKKTRIWDEEDA